MVLDIEITRAKIANKNKLPLKESLINQEPIVTQERTVSGNPSNHSTSLARSVGIITNFQPHG